MSPKFQGYERAALKSDKATQQNHERFQEALALHQKGDIPGALVIYSEILRKTPAHFESLHMMGVAHYQSGNTGEAEKVLSLAIEINPRSAALHNNFGNVLKRIHKIHEALAHYNLAVEINPQYADGYYNQGSVLYLQQDYEGALKSFDKAISLNPNNVNAHNNRGAVLRKLNRLDDSLRSYLAALQLSPNCAQAHFNYAIVSLQKGNFGEGWEEYEWRKVKPEPLGNRSFPAPIPSDTAELNGKTILVHWEQGLGDTIQFCRYLPLIGLHGASVILAPQNNLAELMRSLNASISVVDVENVEIQYDYHVPLMSLPRLFRSTLESIPGDVPYLSAEATRVANWSARLGNHGFRVGICWQGGTTAVDVGRSFPLSMFSSISRIDQVRLISLHKGDGECQLKNLPAGMRVETLGSDVDSGGQAFLDTAAIMMNLDLVITSDTSIAHLAGALGRPVWIALKQVPDWRWLLDRNDSPWYPTARLFRQQVRDDWAAVFDQIEFELREHPALKALQGG